MHKTLGLAPNIALSACVFLVAGVPTNAEPPMPLPVLPQIPNRSFHVTDFGAVGDGTTYNTEALQKAIKACSDAGGGTVVVPKGRFLTRPFTLASNLNFHLDEGAVLLLSTDTADYLTPTARNRQCIDAVGCHDVEITGRGTIDGQGGAWWPRYAKTYVRPAGTPPPMHRPYMVVFTRCSRVLIEDVTLTNSPSFHLVPAECQDVTVRDIKIIAPDNAQNTDGMDPSGWNFLITGCTFDVGDDCIALKPVGRIAPDQPSCRNFLIEKCVFHHGHGMSIGGQTPGGLENMTVRDCTFDSTQAGIRMKAPRGNGGLVQNVLYERLTMTNVKVPIYITSYYPSTPVDPAADPRQDVDAKTPIWKNVQIRDVTSTGSPEAGRIIGLPEMPVDGVTFTNVKISAEKGMQITHARGIKFVNSSISAGKRPAITSSDADVTGLADAESAARK